MKKYYILTFNKINNYGAFWQSYALQKSLGNCVDSYHVNYIYSIDRLDLIKQRLRYLNPVKFFKKLKQLSSIESVNCRLTDRINRSVDDGLFLERSNFYDKARQKYLRFTDKTYTPKSIKKLNQDDAVFIVGSDQMWNYNFFTKHMLNRLLLDFVEDNKAKNSYAVSFGVYDVPDEYKKLYSNCISKFNKISVRETSGAEIVKKLTGRTAEVVLDPTLLLDKKQWNDKIGFKSYDEKYILIYTMKASEYTHLHKVAQEISEKTGFKIYSIENYPNNYSVNPINASPEEFLDRFYSAEYVVTDSFHGTIFSINFNKKFFVRTFTNGSAATMNTRIDSITQMLGLEDRVIDGNNDLLAEIDYDRVNKVLEEKRKESLEFLESILEE